MSTLAEIEAAIVSLTPQEMAHLGNLLHELRAKAEEKELEEIYRRIGLHSLPPRGDMAITNEMVQRLREEDDIF